MTLKFIAVTGFAAFALFGCAQKPSVPDVYTPPTSTPVSEAAPRSEVVPSVAEVRPSAEDFRVNVGDTVRFAYDAFAIEGAAQSTLERQAAWLNRYPMVTIVIEGHCDERGTREYNLALGARRASAVREFLISHGVSANRLETTSFGKERPVCAASNDDCWAQNRRGVSRISAGANS